MADTHKIKEQIGKIPSLESISPYGTEYQLWDKLTEGLVRQVFGEAAAKLFHQQESVIIPNDDDEWQKQYINDLGKKRRALEGMLTEEVTLKSLKKTEVSGTRPSEPRGEGFWSKFIWTGVVALIVAVAAGLILHFGFGI